MPEQQPFSRWGSHAGRAALARVLRRETPLSSVAEDQSLPEWETTLINRALRRLARRRRRRLVSPRDLARTARELALELDVFRKGDEAGSDVQDRMDSPLFKGRRAHLAQLLAFRRWAPGWDRWRRRTKVVPDLRGARLGDLDLRHINFSRARLRGADLSASVLRVTDFRHADMRECHLRHTDLSYADLRGARLGGAHLDETLLTNADLRGADLRRAFLVGTSMNQAKLQGADLRGAVVWGVSAWEVEDDATTRQEGLLVVPGLDPVDYDEQAVRRPDMNVQVNDLEVAHFMSLLTGSRKIGRVISAAVDRTVLLLGRFVGPERGVLDTLRQALPTFGYVPVVFDFAEPENRDTIETVAILAGLSHFVIANLSRPRSTPLEAHLVITATAVPFVPLVRAGESPFAMFTALQRKYRWVLPTVTYRSEANLLHKLRSHIIEPVERVGAAIRRLKQPRR